ncbi:MAG: hypothetical protein R2726_11375 [Acidimicrobiales bacterium]
MALSMAVAEAGPEPEAVLEATYGWYWAADLFEHKRSLMAKIRDKRGWS